MPPPKNQRRRDHMTQLLSEMHFSRWSFETPIPKDQAVGDPRMKGARSSPSKISHAVTYMNLLERALNSDHEYFFIMEDDIVPVKGRSLIDSRKRMQEAFDAARKLDSGFDMLFFEYCLEGCLLRQRVHEKLHKLTHPLCAANILYSKAGARKILGILKPVRFAAKHFGPDTIISREILNGTLTAYGRLLFVQDPKFGSDLEGSGRHGYDPLQALETPICMPHWPISLSALVILFVFLSFKFIRYRTHLLGIASTIAIIVLVERAQAASSLIFSKKM